KAVRCPMPGLVVSISVAEGQEVKAGETLAVVEAMKMENVLRAERDGVVKAIKAKPGDSLAVAAVIIEFAGCARAEDGSAGNERAFRAALPLFLSLIVERHDAAFRVRIEHEPRAYDGALPGRGGDRHGDAVGLALRHQSRRLRIDCPAAGRTRARRAVAAQRARPCRRERL